MAILLISSELPEVLAMADRVLVMHEGRLTGEFVRGEADQEGVMFAATGQAGQGGRAARAANEPAGAGAGGLV